MALSIPISCFRRFEKKDNGQRWGQQFYEYMELHKVTSPFDKVWCDALYNASDVTARQMVLNAIDHGN